jgi:hypothetical protein
MLPCTFPRLGIFCHGVFFWRDSFFGTMPLGGFYTQSQGGLLCCGWPDESISTGVCLSDPGVDYTLQLPGRGPLTPFWAFNADILTASHLVDAGFDCTQKMARGCC